MLKDLIILGAGGTSREIMDAIIDINSQRNCWNLLGFLDDDITKQGKKIKRINVLGPITSAPCYSAQLIIGVASVRGRLIRKKIIEELGVSAERFATIVHPSAMISPSASYGAGTTILHNAIIMSNVMIGNHVVVEYGAMIGHDSIIEDNVIIGPGTIISGAVRLCRGAYVGAGSTIREDIRIGKDALIGMGAVVVKNVQDGTTMIGNPARPLYNRSGSQEIKTE